MITKRHNQLALPIHAAHVPLVIMGDRYELVSTACRNESAAARSEPLGVPAIGVVDFFRWRLMCEHPCRDDAFVPREQHPLDKFRRVVAAGFAPHKITGFVDVACRMI